MDSSSPPKDEPKDEDQENVEYQDASNAGILDLDGEPIENSPVEEVALTVPITDDPSLPIWTLRMWILGFITCGFLSFVNQFFYYRTAPLIITAITAQILSLYLGRFMAAIMPKWSLFGLELNPGPFNMKEHVLITIFANAGSGFGSGPAYAVDIVTLVKSPAFYNSNISFWAGLIIANTTQVLGYGWAGLLRRYLVDPAHMWWPDNLINVTLFHTLHDKDTGQGMSRIQFFVLFSFASFFYYILPGYLFTALTSLAILCYIWKNSIVAQQIGSGYSGMGIGAFTFDWATISAFNGSPLATPWFAIVNIFLGFIAFMWLVQPIFYWTNGYNARTYEFFGSDLFLQNGTFYDVTAVLNPDTLELDPDAYAAYGPPFISSFFALTYGVSFAALSAMVVHVVLWYGRDIYERSRASAVGKPDIHTRLMKRYPAVPEWWFITIGILSVALSIFACEHWKASLQLPWWGVIFAAGLSGVLTLPIGIIAATTNQVPGLNVVTELIMGYILPGKPIANVLFKTLGYISSTQAISFLADLKLGHYMKIPPRSMFIVQVVGTMLAASVNMGTAWWQLTSITDICNTAVLPPSSPWTCPSSKVFFDASVIWGLIGPKRIFGSEGYYSALNWMWLVGAILPIPFWVAYKLKPKWKVMRAVNMPIFLGATGIAPPAGTINFTSWFAVGFVFQFWIFRYHKKWWSRYNYVLSAALECGVAFMGIAIFFAFQNNNRNVNWWGNDGECPIAFCPTTYDASIGIGDPCPIWGTS